MRHFSKFDVETPQPVIDIDILDRNINRMAAIAKDNGVHLRPHIKTHRTPAIAHKQIRAGANGITVAKLGEAEVMASCGINDILIAFPIVGEEKINRLINLSYENNLITVVDSLAAASEISRIAAKRGVKIKVLAEVDVGANRCGLNENDIIGFVKTLVEFKGIEFVGLLSYSGQARGAKDIDQIKEIALHEGNLLVACAERIGSEGISCPIRSAGSTPTAPYVARVKGITEIRCGNYVFNDVGGINNGVAAVEDCALTVICTVVSKPNKNRIIIDGGLKTFTSDRPNDLTGNYGYIKNENGLVLEKLSEEHGIISVPNNYREIRIGEKLEIIPNHACVIPNLTEYLYYCKGEEVIGKWPVLCRGKSI